MCLIPNEIRRTYDFCFYGNYLVLYLALEGFLLGGLEWVFWYLENVGNKGNSMEMETVCERYLILGVPDLLLVGV